MSACTIERYLNRPDWLRGRKTGLGGSDSPAVLGMSRFRGAYSVHVDKTTEGIDDGQPDTTAEWGLRLEEPIAQKFAEVTKLTIVDPGQYTIYRSVERPHLFCTPDRLVGDDGVLEIKTAHFGAGKEWADKIPLGYQVQLQHTLYVTGRTMGYFAVLADGHLFKWHSMRRHDKFIERMLVRLDAFWASIQRGEMPNVDASQATAEALARRFPKPTDGVIELPDDFLQLGEQYDQILEQQAALEKQKLLIQNLAKEAIGDMSVGVLPDQSGFSWRANGKGRRFARVAKVNVE
jgi:putative phage-type endonuclease